MNTTQKPPERFLTHDEEISFPALDDREATFRIRVWQGSDATPIVLASQKCGPSTLGKPPGEMSEKIANFVNAAILGYPTCGMLYFEGEWPAPGAPPWLTQVYFEYFGYAHRIRMYRPIHKKQLWAFLEYIIGSQVEH